MLLFFLGSGKSKHTPVAAGFTLNDRLSLFTPSSSTMSTTATSLVPSSVRSATDSALQSAQNVGSALQSTQNVVSSEVASTTGYLKAKAQELRLTPSKSATRSTDFSTPTASPGNFRHPQITEILARNSAASLSDRRVKGAVTNAAALLLSFMFSNAFCSTYVTTSQVPFYD